MKLSNFLIIFCALSACHFANAGRLTVEKAEKFFKDKKPCTLVIAPVYPVKNSKNDVSVSSASQAGMAKNVSRFNMQVTGGSDGEIEVSYGHPDGDVDMICIFDGTKNQGTINEIKGCFAGYYNPAKDEWRGLLKESVGKSVVIEGKTCTSEVVAELLGSSKIAEGLKKTDGGRTFKAYYGNFNSVFELYLRTASSILNTDLRIIYDPNNVVNSLCPKKPCGPVIHIQDQLAAIKPDPGDVERQKQFEQDEKKRKETEQAQKEVDQKFKLDAEANAKANKANLVKCSNKVEFQEMCSECSLREGKCTAQNSDSTFSDERDLSGKIQKILPICGNVFSKLKEKNHKIAFTEVARLCKEWSQLKNVKSNMTKTIESNDFPNMNECHIFCDTHFANGSENARKCIQACKKRFED